MAQKRSIHGEEKPPLFLEWRQKIRSRRDVLQPYPVAEGASLASQVRCIAARCLKHSSQTHCRNGWMLVNGLFFWLPPVPCADPLPLGVSAHPEGNSALELGHSAYPSWQLGLCAPFPLPLPHISLLERGTAQS